MRARDIKDGKSRLTRRKVMAYIIRFDMAKWKTG